MRSAKVRKRVSAAGIAALLMVSIFGGMAQAAGINATKHDFSINGPGPIRAVSETRICVFCHTPHNSAPVTKPTEQYLPLWNREDKGQTYTVYTVAWGTTSGVKLLPPTGPTKLCLSCHDGTIALGSVLNPASGITMNGPSFIPAGSPANFGLDLSSHHPVSFPYGASNPRTVSQLVNIGDLPSSVVLSGSPAAVHCNSCHNPHDNTYGKFLVMDNTSSALCTTCHLWTGYPISFHTLTEGCDLCHTPHFASARPLLKSSSASELCLTCHDPLHSASPLSLAKVAAAGAATSATADIGSQLKKWSAHRVNRFLPAGSSPEAAAGLGGVSCSDCHNPHRVNRKKSLGSRASGMLEGVSGLDRNGMKVAAATFEYEVCYKCHADNTADTKFIPRVVNTTNKRTAFDPSNASYHPVAAMGRNLSLPSIPSSLEPSMSASAMILCTDCHRDDAGGAKGPHGSSFAPILRERYETADNTPENYQNYALCYRCHSRSSILGDMSFQKKTVKVSKSGGGHSGHLAAGAPCSACHDPHGVPSSGGLATGDHTSLINFDARIVAARTGSRYPVFNRKGQFGGSCTLVCHGRVHNGESYP